MITRTLEKILRLTLALTWAIAGLAKLSQSIFPDPNTTPAWTDQFHPALTVSVSIAEILLALAFISSRRRSVILMAIALLASIAVAAVLYPPTQSQSCGCLGNLATLDAQDILAHITFFTGLHALLLVLNLPQNPPQPNPKAA